MFPIAATIYTQALNRFMNAHPLIHLSTFGGSDIGCRVALKALEIYEATALWENAAGMGAMLKAGLEEIMGDSRGRILSVNGSGLLLSIELADGDQAKALCKAASEKGVLLLPGEVAEHTVVIRPPLTVWPDDVSAILKGIREAIAQ